MGQSSFNPEAQKKGVWSGPNLAIWGKDVAWPQPGCSHTGGWCVAQLQRPLVFEGRGGVTVLIVTTPPPSNLSTHRETCRPGTMALWARYSPWARD